MSADHDFEEPGALGDEEAREWLKKRVYEPHVKPLNRFVDTLRSQADSGFSVPYVDPNDGGVESRILLLLEAPGPQAASTTGFVSRNNPDQTAGNLLNLLEEAGLERSATLIWNVVPWYLGDGKRIRPARQADILEAKDSLIRFIGMCTRLETVVLMGNRAQSASAIISGAYPDVDIVDTPHPSPQFINRHPNNRSIILEPLKALA